MSQWITFETRAEAEESLSGLGYEFAPRPDADAPLALW